MNAKFIDMIKYFNVHIVVSVDTLNQDKWKFIRGTDSYEIVMNNLDYALKELNSNQISLQSVLAKETLDDVKQVGLFASERNVFFHSIQDYMQEGFEGSWTPLKKTDKRLLVILNVLLQAEIYLLCQMVRFSHVFNKIKLMDVKKLLEI